MLNKCPGLEAHTAMVMLSIDGIVGLFIILAAGISAAVFVFLVEYLVFKIRSHKKIDLTQPDMTKEK